MGPRYCRGVNSACISTCALRITYGSKNLIGTGALTSSPAVSGGVVYVGSADGNVYALNANTGAKLWGTATSGGVNSSPTVVNGTVYVGSGDEVYAADRSASPTSPQT